LSAFHLKISKSIADYIGIKFVNQYFDKRILDFNLIEKLLYPNFSAYRTVPQQAVYRLKITAQLIRI